MDWFKCYNGASQDIKFPLIAKKYRLKVYQVSLCWWHFCDYASQEKERGNVSGLDFEAIDFFYEFEEGTSEKAFNAFVDRKMITEGRLTKWDERQKNEAAERQKRYRERLKESNSDNGDVTLRNEHNTLPEERRREEKRGEEKRGDINNNISSSSSTSVGDAKASDDEVWIYESGLRYFLSFTKRQEPELKTIIRGWLEFYDPAKIRTLIQTAQTSARADPVSYIQQALKNEKSKTGMGGVQSTTGETFEEMSARVSRELEEERSNGYE